MRMVKIDNKGNKDKRGTAMGYDAIVHIDKRKYTEKTIEDLFLMLGYEKRQGWFYFGKQEEYKYVAGVQAWKDGVDENKHEINYWIRVQSFCSSYDLKKANETISALKKYCFATFESDEGKNRYFQIGPLIKGAENGCYIAISRLDNNFSLLLYSLKKYPEDLEQEKIMNEFGCPTPNSFNANVYLSYLCALMEEYFRSTYVALLKYSDKKEKILNYKFSPYDLIEVSKGKITIEEVYARSLSFQNIQKIVYNYKNLNGKLDISTPLKQPYHGRKKSLYEQINEIFERRHRMVHRVNIDDNYKTEQLEKDICDIKVAFKRVYQYLCNQYGWEIQDIII